MTPEGALREAEVAFTNIVNQRSAVSDALAVPHFRDVERIWKAMLPFLVPTADLDRLRASLEALPYDKGSHHTDATFMVNRRAVLDTVDAALGDRAAEEEVLP